MGWWSISAAALLIGAPLAFALTAGIRFAALTRRSRLESAEIGADGVGGRGIARLIAAGASGYAAGAAVVAITAVIGLIAALVSRARGEGIDIGTVRLPVAETAISELPATAVPGLSEYPLGAGFFSEVTLWAPPISNGTAALYFAPAIITPLLHLIVAIGIATLAECLDRGAPFVPRLGRVATVTGWSLVVLGTASDLLQRIGIDRASREVLADGSLGAVFGISGLDLTSAVAGFAVLLMGSLVQRGLALQRDTAGLV